MTSNEYEEKPSYEELEAQLRAIEERLDNLGVDDINKLMKDARKGSEVKPRGHILRGVLKQLLDHPAPTEEAAQQAGIAAGAAGGIANWSGRAQVRAAYTMRWLKALQDTMHYASEAFSQVAEEAMVEAQDAGGDLIDAVATAESVIHIRSKESSDA